MSAVPFEVRRYKDKNYLAKTFIMSCIFCKNTHFSPNGCRFDCIFNITPTCFYRNVWIWTVPPVDVMRNCRPL